MAMTTTDAKRSDPVPGIVRTTPRNRPRTLLKSTLPTIAPEEASPPIGQMLKAIAAMSGPAMPAAPTQGIIKMMAREPLI
jgi:hypothetical protein